jgi:ribonuclease HI
MELIASISPVVALKSPGDVDPHSDSQYVHKGIHEWMPSWIRRGWKTAAGEPVKNQDLWIRLKDAAAPHAVRWHWVRGHAGHPDNERVDRLARNAAERLRAGARN